MSVALVIVSACDGTVTVDTEGDERDGAHSASGAPAFAGAPDSDGAYSGAGGAGEDGGVGGSGGSGHDQAGAPSPDGACDTGADCPGTANECSWPVCHDGSCATLNAPQGTFVHFGDAACFSAVCDGAGELVIVVDTNHQPPVTDDCALRACSATGEVVVTTAPLGSTCGVDGGKYCDADGSCVGCLSEVDCDDGEICSQGGCDEASISCSDGHINGDETDIDCGGSCGSCGVGKDCWEDSDCTSQACNYYAPQRCVADHCLDQHKDSDETDVDCGGTACAPCIGFAYCAVDADCTSGECHDSFGFCLPDHCTNQVMDAGEMAVDCGDTGCYGCALGSPCATNAGCLSQACDAISLTCIADHCEDHHHDADESDLDCGGATCAGCTVGKKCVSGSDCAPSLTCAA
ncbi:MAG TPA: hypothetical protein VM686_33045, partial [Polyangiaceae bacterium]|nr:hypothetical protein [Polyangiaceae bacterium]